VPDEGPAPVEPVVEEPVAEEPTPPAEPDPVVPDEDPAPADPVAEEPIAAQPVVVTPVTPSEPAVTPTPVEPVAQAPIAEDTAPDSGIPALINGDFETIASDADSKGSWYLTKGADAAGNQGFGWTAANGGLIEIQQSGTAGITAFDGKSYIELDSHGRGTSRPLVTQAFAAKDGTALSLDFAFAERQGAGDGSSDFELFWDGALVATFTNAQGSDAWRVVDADAKDGIGVAIADHGAAGGWFTASVTGLIADGRDSIAFQGLAAQENTHGTFLDAISLRAATKEEAAKAAEPEPAPKNTAPADIALSTTSVNERVAPGSVIAALATKDADGADTHSYTLVQDPSGLFEIRDGALALREGAALDREEAANHTIMLRSTDTNGDSVERSFTLTVADARERQVSGTAKAEDLKAEDGDADIHGRGGNDKLEGKNGADRIWGGDGNDDIKGDNGDDLLWGGAGNDTLDGENEDDQLWGGLGRDSLAGGNHDDTLHGEGGHDTLDGGNHDDLLWGGEGNDLMLGDNGNDWFDAGPGADTIHGGNDDDVLALEPDGLSDRFFGGNGRDTVLLGEQAGGFREADGWTLKLTSGRVTSQGEGFLNLSDGADGEVGFADGSTLRFEDVERLTWQMPA
jgi:Ca2+-binding RTX toxin-like protein